mmetsp:Transcript_12028/g.30309  ORF Transcript_12028/g.30309 Transcript_12028/m.30309 type:complete len:83 (+) Transcript_12028:44-292(+)
MSGSVRDQIEGFAENARSRRKTGLPEKEGDEDLIHYYYMIMHPNTAQGKAERKEYKQEWPEMKERLAARFGEWMKDEKIPYT